MRSVFSEWLIPAPCEPYLPIISMHERSMLRKRTMVRKVTRFTS